MGTYYLTEKEFLEKNSEGIFGQGDVVRITDRVFGCEEDWRLTNKVVCGSYPGVCGRIPSSAYRAVCSKELEKDIKRVNKNFKFKMFSNFSRLEL